MLPHFLSLHAFAPRHHSPLKPEPTPSKQLNSTNQPHQNKTNSAVQLIHKPTNTVVKSQATRSRSQNQKIARRLLAEKIELLEKGDKSRVSIKAEASKKKKASKAKKSRRKYRALEEKGKVGEAVEEDVDVEEVVEFVEEGERSPADSRGKSEGTK